MGRGRTKGAVDKKERKKRAGTKKPATAEPTQPTRRKASADRKPREDSQSTLPFGGAGAAASSSSSSAGAASSSSDAAASGQAEDEQQPQDEQPQQQMDSSGEQDDANDEEIDAPHEEEAEDGDFHSAEQSQPRAAVDAVEIDDEEGLRSVTATDSITMVYFRMVRERLRVELSSRGPATNAWLINRLRRDDFWLRARDARSICDTLGVQIDGFSPVYVKDLRVWLPHLQFGHLAFCPGCESNAHVGVHGFRTSLRAARRVTAINDDYFAMSCRYICHSCQGKAAVMKAAATAAAEAAGLRCEDAEDDDGIEGDDDEYDGDTQTAERKTLTPKCTFSMHSVLPLLPLQHPQPDLGCLPSPFPSSTNPYPQRPHQWQQHAQGWQPQRQATWLAMSEHQSRDMWQGRSAVQIARLRVRSVSGVAMLHRAAAAL